MSPIEEVARALISGYLSRHDIDPWGSSIHSPDPLLWPYPPQPASAVILIQYPLGEVYRVFSSHFGSHKLRSGLLGEIKTNGLGLFEASVWHSYIVQLPK